MQAKTNIEEGTDILRSYRYIFLLCKFFYEITDCHWIKNGKTFFKYWIWKNSQLNIRIASQIDKKFPVELKFEGEAIF